jgi:thiol-disulfide isomerase/thioredoxin
MAVSFAPDSTPIEIIQGGNDMQWPIRNSYKEALPQTGSALLLIGSIVCMFAASVSGQDAPAATAETAHALTPVEQQFFDHLTEIRNYLLEAGRFGLTGDCTWEMASPAGTANGTLHVKLAIGSGQRVRLEIGPSAAAPPGFVVISDGMRLFRSYVATNRYCLLDTPTPRDDLENDGITMPAVQATGMQFLIRTNPQGSLRAQTTHVEALGTVDVGGQPCTRYRIVLANGERWTLDLAQAKPPLPQQLTAETTIASQEEKVTRYTARSVFHWLKPSDVSDGLFAISPPAGGQQVASLAELRGDAIHQDTPHQLAAMQFENLDGSPVTIAQARGDRPMVIYFWASWATPSADAMPAINRFLQEYSAKDVRFLAVNVGDAPDHVAQIAKERGLNVPLACDPKAVALEPFGIKALPGVAVFDSQGELILSLDGSTAERLAKVKASLDAVLR